MKAKTKGESQNVREGVHVRLKAEGGRMKNALNSPSFILHPSAFSLGFRLPSRSGYRLCTSFFLSFVLLAQAVFATLPTVPPAKVAMSAERLAFIDAAANEAIERKETPGAVVLVARRGAVVWRKAYGSRAGFARRRKETPGAVVLVARRGAVVWRKAYGSRVILPRREAMTTDTIFDLASLTKIVATATSVMILVERGQVRLSDPASRYIPELKGEGREKITVEQLLTHRSGFAPDFDLSEQWSGYDEMLKRLYREPLRSAPGARFVYSDINFITLGEVGRRASGQPLAEFARRNIYEPLGMRDTGFRRIGEGNAPPPRTDAATLARLAPTENVRGVKSYLGGTGEQGSDGERILRGGVP